MITAEPDLEQLLQALDELRPNEFELVEKHIANLKKRRQPSFPPKTFFDDETFWLPYEDYLKLSEATRRNILFYAYNQYGDWICTELARRFAKWMIVCGGKIVAWPYRFHDHPSREKLNMIGMQTGYTPFVFDFPISESDSPALRRPKRLRKREDDANN